MAGAGVSYDQLHAAFSHEKFEPLYFFYGEETFLMGELQELLLERALQPHERDFNLDVLYGPDSDARQVLATCAGYPMMAARRVVVVREFEKLNDNRLFVSYAENPNPQAVVVLVCGGKPNLSTHPYRALRQHATCCEFKALEARKLPGWIERRLETIGRSMEPRAVQMLADVVASSGLHVAATEVDKIVTFAGAREQLTVDDVIQAGGQTRDFNVFELQRMVSEREFERAATIAEQLLRYSSNPRGDAMRMLFVLGSFFTKLWRLAAATGRGLPNAELARVAGIRPYFLKEYLQALKRWRSRELEHAFQALLAADFELKGGSSRDENLVVLLMIHRMFGRAASAHAA